MTGFDFVANGQRASLIRWGNLTREERFWAKVVKTAGCWIWTGANDGRGYSVFWDGTLTTNGNKRAVKAYRYSYELAKGKVPLGLTIDHLCRNRMCVNPEHLEAVTNKENVLRGVSVVATNYRKTHCKNGHPLIAGNLSLHRLRKGTRLCLTCERASGKRAEAKRRLRESVSP